jgi:hypothetical protein
VEEDVASGRAPRRLMRRGNFTIPAVAVAVFALFAGLYQWARPVYDIALNWYGIHPFEFPFLDLDAITGAVECFRQGLDVYTAHPCDVLGRPHVYSPLWLSASVLPITRAWTTPVGLGLDLAFLLSLAAVPVPVERRNQWLMLAAVLSTMSVYAVERANNDVVIFLLVLVAGVALAQPPAGGGTTAWRRCAYPLILLAGMLKFYPIVGLIVSLRERRLAFINVNLVMFFAVLIFIGIERNELARVLAMTPIGPYYTDFFGAKNLPYGVAQLIFTPSWEPMIRFLPSVLLVVLCSYALWRAAALARRPALQIALPGLEEREKMLLILGGAMLAGCFFAGQSIGYRGIFFLLVLPGLFALARRTLGDEASISCRAAVPLILFVMWSDVLRHAIFAAEPLELPGWGIIAAVFWLAREIIWWHIIAVLGGILLCFVLTSPVWGRVSSDQTTLKISLAP